MASQSRITGRRLTRRSLLAVGALAAGGLLVACAPAAPPTPTPAPKPAEAPKPAAPAAPTPTAAAAPTSTAAAAPKPAAQTVVKFHTRLGSHADWHKSQVPKFEAENPGIKLELDELPGGEMFAKVYAMSASKTVGDVVWTYTNSTTEHVAKNVLRPVDDLVAADKLDISVWWPAIIKALSVKGKLYALPNHGHYGTAAYYINDELYKANDVPLPTAAWTVDDVLAQARKNTKAPDTWGFRTNANGQEHVPQWLRTWGGDVFSADGTKCLLAEPASVEALKWLYDLVHAHKVSPDLTGAQVKETFLAGKVAAYNWTTGYASEFAVAKPPFKWSTMVAPKGPKGKRGSQVAGTGFGITNNSKNPGPAFQVLKFFSSKDDGIEHVYGGAGSPGPRFDVWQSERLNQYNPIFKMIVDNIGEPEPWYFPANDRTSEAVTALANTLDAIWVKKATFEEGVKQAQAEVQAIMNKPPA